jgi:CheY-like chemotaxis protein
MTNTPSKITVLVVDDEFLIRANAVELLQDAGFNVLEAETGDHAMEIMADHTEISVLFTDINMPGSLDGLELARRAHLARPKLKIILTSGRVRPSEPIEPLGGIFVEKPYVGQEIVKLIKSGDVNKT